MLRVRWLLPPAGVLAMAAPVGLVRAQSSEASVLAAVACAAAGFGEGGVTSPTPEGASSFEQAGTTITIRRKGGTLSWTSSVPVAGVLVRGGGTIQPWPVTRATSGDGAAAPSIDGAASPIDDVTFCFPAPEAPAAPAPQALGLSITAQGSFTRVPAAVTVRGTVTVHNPNPTSASIAGLEVQPSTKGACTILSPLEVPSGDTPIVFTCDIDIPDAARQGSVSVSARSGSASTPAATTVRWLESAG